MKKFENIKAEFEVGDNVLYCAEFKTESGFEYQERLVKVCDRVQYSRDGKWGYAVKSEDGTFFGLHLCNLKAAA